MKTKILSIKGNWQDILNDCRNTVSKEPLGKEPSEKFKKSILISEHSPIRDICIRWKWESIKSWISVHFSRHKWECFISTRRTDRTGINRDELRQDELVSMVGDANVQQLIDTARKRLCFCASDETREYMEDLKTQIYLCEPEIANVLVPNCVYRGGCPEMLCCGKFDFTKYTDIDIQKRYDEYNKDFYNSKKSLDK